MFKEKIAIKEVRRFVLATKKEILLVNNNSTLCSFDFYGNKIYDSGGLRFHAETVVNNNIILNDYNCIISLDNKVSKLNDMPDDFWNVGKMSEEGIMFFTNGKENIFYDVINQKRYLVLKDWWDNRGFYTILKEYFITVGVSSIFCHPLSSGEEKWRLDLNVLLDAERATVYGDMFEHQGRLFFYAYEVEPRKHYIVCVSVETGEVLLKIENLGSYSLQYVDGYVYDMQGFMLYRINCADLTVTTTDFSQHLKPVNWSHHDPNKWRIANGRIYCICQMGISSRRVRLVIIDIASQKLLYNKELKHKPARLLMELRIQDNRIYCLTDAGTLYIYEEEIAKL